MQEIIPSPRRKHEDLDHGCAFLLEGPNGRRICGAPCQTSSSYCAHHHSLCHVACGSRAERRRLREVETLANAVGGRRARQGVAPSRQFLERLEQTIRDFF
jgi:hypothetical protein